MQYALFDAKGGIRSNGRAGATIGRAMQLQDQKSQSRRSEPLYGVIHSVLRDHLKRGALIDGLVLGESERGESLSDQPRARPR